MTNLSKQTRQGKKKTNKERTLMSEEYREYISSVERWPGNIKTKIFLSWLDLEKWELALKEAQKISESETSVVSFFSVLLPIALSVIKEWHIEGLPEKIETADDLPASPELAAFIVDCISKLFQETNSLEKS